MSETTPESLPEPAANPLADAIVAAAAEPFVATIEVKGISLPVMHAWVNSLEPEQITAALKTRFGKNVARFFDNDPVLLDLSRLESEPASVDWDAVRAQFAGASLQLMAIYGGNSELQASARSAGLAVIEAASVPVPRAAKAQEDVPVVEEIVAEAPIEAAPEEVKTEQAAAMVIDKPLRSGQRIYARGGDLVVLAMVSAGAEVIADGNIHIYAPLRGRALAGASGDTNARIFTTSFEAELVSIAGVYRTFETKQFGKLAQQPVQVSLAIDANKPDAEPTLQVNALATK